MPNTSAAQTDKPVDRDLLTQFLSAYAFQPATALWRALELPALIKLGIPQGRGIDIGCGDGKLTAILMHRIGHRDLVGVDPDPEEAAEAKRRKIYTTVYACGADRIPEASDTFDFAISNSTLEHIPELDPVLAETARVLRPGGLFLLTVPHSYFHAQLAGPLMPGVKRDEYEAQLDKRLAHYRYPSATAWTDMLGRHGFVTEETLFYLDRTQVQRWETVSRFTAGLLSSLSGGRTHPVNIQRRFGLRQFQNRHGLPRPAAALGASMLAMGLPLPPPGLTEEKTGCIAIRCRKKIGN